ncbi:hypothetical protein M0G74_04175 [Microbulbifer sp. CAU 1566]|uniref:hypothetical protein n=1 Tax=Microbulbifer sp. CAU 1566 TaxID=2933269 RepID=UPI0020054D6F|nr:hypothetical protein [Microbulbifer sp. CAU 1566]MCK7596466.1 hypothetical protein [Microbulbifer sp. CAU 1566]
MRKRQMGTKSETTRLQQEIKQLIDELGWKQNLIAEKIYYEENDTDNEDELRRFQERFKKELSRGTTKPERLKKYLSMIPDLPGAEGIDLVSNKFVPTGAISDALVTGLKAISKEIDTEIRIYKSTPEIK